MKTFGDQIHILSRPILTRLSLSAILLLIFIFQSVAQGKLTGFVVNDEFNEPLEKAVVTIPRTRISVLTDQQGKYVLKMMAGDYFMEVNYPGHIGRKYNISVVDGITTPMFIVKLKAKTIGRAMQRSITSFENKQEIPQTIEDFSTWQATEQIGNQEFNEAIKSIPSTGFLSNGNGFNDSEIGFRGNDPNSTSYTFNGILLNNPETGRMTSNTISGLSDWAGHIQVTTGQAANLQSQTSYGGTVNVQSYLPREKAGADLLAIYGNNGFLKTSATIHSGLSKKGLASTLQISRTSGDGLTQNTAFEQYVYFLNIHKELNHFHSLVFSLNGTLQENNRNFSDSIGAYNAYGTRYNRNQGILNEKPISWSTNYNRSPIFSMTHFWQHRIKTQISTQLFAQFSRSAQLFPGGQAINSVSRDSLGRVLLDQVTAWNKGQSNVEMGTAPLPDQNGKFYNTESSGITSMAAITSENRFGLRSVVKHEYSKVLKVSASFNLEQYQANHHGTVFDFLGADGYTSFSDLNRPEGFNVENLFGSSFFPNYKSADQTTYSYTSDIQTAGISFRLDYQKSRYYWYFEGSGSIQNMQRTDHFNYLTSDSERKSSSLLFPGGRAQTGIRMNLWKYHSIHFKTNYGSYQPVFSVLYPTGNNWENGLAKNKQIFDSEFGYSVFSRKLRVEALAYYSRIFNQSTVRYLNINGFNSFATLNGLNELHQGVELKTSYKITKNLQLNLNGSLGDWNYSKDAKVQIYDSNNLQTEENELLLKGVKLANAPQFSIFAEAEYRWAHNFYIRLNYYRADQIYAPFGLNDFKNLQLRSDFKQWQIPKYDLIGASGNYLIKFRKSQELNLIFGVKNILDSEYIEQSATNIREGNTGYTSNQVYYGMGRTWFAGLKFMF